MVVPLQFNLHLTKWDNNNENDMIVQHDCLRIDAWMDSEDIYEITTYCISEWPLISSIQTNNLNRKFTFSALFERNISSEDLYLWSAPMDIVEDYEDYLNETSTSNKTLLSKYEYFNCTLPEFGRMCEYSFDEYRSSYSSLNDIIYEFYRNNQENVKNQTCFTHLQCDLGSISLCIGWMNICDGIIQCINGTDEEHCWQLEINECKENEYQCKNGQCIASNFLNDNDKSADCLDGSDENKYYTYAPSWNPKGPLFKAEEVSCIKDTFNLLMPIFGETKHCFDSYFFRFRHLLLFPEQPNTISDICWLAMTCYLNFRQDWFFTCDQNFKPEIYKNIITEECPDMFFMPNAPIAFGHIYFVYTKEYFIEQNQTSNKPEYICYNDKLCGGFRSNATVILFNNSVCRRPDDFSFEYNNETLSNTFFGYFIELVNVQLKKCDTVPRSHSIFCNESTMYQCKNSSKCIPQIRLFDNKQDCDYNDDELWISTDEKCPIKSHHMYFNCTKSNQCISGKLFNDGPCHCPNAFDLNVCDDEPNTWDYPKYQISFQRICDNNTDLNPIFVDGLNRTDETECEQWPCNNIYTHCDGLWNCFNGEDELGCYPSSIINCSLDSYTCLSPETGDFMCLSANKMNDGNIDCLGTVDEPQCCNKYSGTQQRHTFFCNLTADMYSGWQSELCDGRRVCSKEEDETLCRYTGRKRLFDNNGICRSKHISIHSDVEEFLCYTFRYVNNVQTIYFSLGKMEKSNALITKRNTNIELTSSLSTKNLFSRENSCYRSPNIRLWLNKEKNLSRISCLCPPSYYGDQCQFQNERVSLTIRFQTFSDSWQKSFIIVVLLIDNSDERIIQSFEQFTYLPVHNCKTKFNIDLLYATRPKNQSRKYSVHIDIYEKLSWSYRGSLLLLFPFPFMPVQRIATLLSIPHTGHDFKNYSFHQCVHGRCVQYFDDPQYSTFCQCHPKWSGRYCNISYNCACSSDSLCVGVLANNRSICVCPMYKWGSRCLLHDRVCQSNDTCYNDGQCIPVDKDIKSEKKFICICQKGFFGDRCEKSENKMILSFERDMILPSNMLIHFIEVKKNEHPENGTTFKMIPIDRYPVTIYWSRPFHIVFVEFFPQNYYLLLLQNSNNESKMNETTLKSSNRCPNISEVFNETFFKLHLIRRIKYYHLVCQQHSPQWSCFHDDVHMCLCQNLNNQRVANCFEFDHKFQRNCRGHSRCGTGASCLQDNDQCPQLSMCICPPCFYGAFCQFSSDSFGLSLDAILGSYIQPYVNIISQPVIVQISITLTVLMTIMGLINGICSMMTFMNKEPQKTGCGFYLLGSSITTLVTTIVFCIKFWILIAAQMGYMTNRSFLYFQCHSIDFILRIGLHMDQWLNACVASERSFLAIKGISFNKIKSRKMVKFVIPILLFVTIGTNVHEIIYRDLLDDDSNDGKRIWCVVSYPKNVQKYNLAMNIFHFCTPFAINLLSAIVIIIKTARLRTTAKAQQNYRQVLLEQLKQHKHLLITSLLLIILGIPRLIISFVSGCMESASDAWLFLFGYFISFIPPILTFFIFVAPSKAYKEEFHNTYCRYRRSLRACFRLSR